MHCHDSSNNAHDAFFISDFDSSIHRSLCRNDRVATMKRRLSIRHRHERSQWPSRLPIPRQGIQQMPAVATPMHCGRPQQEAIPSSAWRIPPSVQTTVTTQAATSHFPPLQPASICMDTVKTFATKDTLKGILLASFYLLWFIGWSLLVFLYQAA